MYIGDMTHVHRRHDSCLHTTLSQHRGATYLKSFISGILLFRLKHENIFEIVSSLLYKLVFLFYFLKGIVF